MNKESLTLQQVYSVRRKNTNPDVAVGVSTVYGDLKNKNYKEIVKFFDQRIRSRYFDVAKQLSERKKHKSGDIFVVMILNCILIDILSQYRYGLESSNQKKYKEFIRNSLSQHNHPISPPFVSYQYFHSKWKKIEIKDIADAIYNGFRCSLIHSGIIAEYGRINQLHKNDVIKIAPWKSDSTKRDINVNPPLLLGALKDYFRQYVRQLRNSKNTELSNNFKKRFQFEFGIISNSGNK